MPKISVIVPVYNGEGYVKRCLDSLVNQTFKDMEIIVINDGSTDKTEDILKEYEEKYKKVKVITKKNEGIAIARNTGLKIAKGEYIGFVDSDDFVSLDMYFKLYEKITSLDYDIAEVNFLYYFDGREKKGVCDLKKDILNMYDLKKYFLNLYPVIWNKLYKRKILEGIKFQNLYAEDVDFLYRIIPRVRRIGLVKDNLYYYYQRENSISKVYDKRLFDYVKIFESLLTYYKENKYYDIFQKEFEFVYVRYLYATFLKRSATMEEKLAYRALVSAEISVKKNFPNYKKNSYFYKSLKGLYLVTFNRDYFRLMMRVSK